MLLETFDFRGAAIMGGLSREAQNKLFARAGFDMKLFKGRTDHMPTEETESKKSTNGMQSKGA